MPAKKHNFTVVEIKAGAMVLTALVIFAVFFAAVQGMRVPEPMNTFYAYFTDTQGLNKGADVRFGGARAGRVISIELDAERRTELRITAEVRPEYPINAESLAMIGQTTLTAEKHLEISTGKADADLLDSEAEIPTGGAGLFDQADEIARSVRTVVDDVIKLLGVDEYAENDKEAAKKGKEPLVTIADIFNDLEGTVEEGTGFVEDVRGIVTDSRDDIGDILDKVQEVEDAATDLVKELDGILEENRPTIQDSLGSLKDVLANAAEITDTLTQRLDDIANTLQAALDNASELTSEAQDMLGDNRPAIEDIVLDIRETVRHLKEFTRTIEQQPGAIIFGQEPEGRE